VYVRTVDAYLVGIKLNVGLEGFFSAVTRRRGRGLCG